MSSILIFLDKKAPLQARRSLEKRGTVIDFETDGIVYDSISGHPDIFMFQWPGGVVVSPDLPEKYTDVLQKKNANIVTGSIKNGRKYPDTAHYNALYTSYGILHNTRLTTPEIRQAHKNLIHCNQAYTRCNAIQAGDLIITSDRGIEEALKNNNIPVIYVNPDNIILPGFRNGFFGGCCGIIDNTLFVCGSISFLEEEHTMRARLTEQNISIIELYDGPPFDVGGIFFLI